MFAELWLTYQLASRTHLKNSATTQLIDLDFQNNKLIDLEDVLEHVFRQGFVEPRYRPLTWWEKGDGLKLKPSHPIEDLLQQGIGKTPETSLKLYIQDMPTTLWFTYVHRHNPCAPHVTQRVKLAAIAGQTGRVELIANLTNHIFQAGYLPAHLRSIVYWETLCGKKIEEQYRIEDVLSWDVGHCEEKPLRLIIDDHHHRPIEHEPVQCRTPISAPVSACPSPIASCPLPVRRPKESCQCSPVRAPGYYESPTSPSSNRPW
ncbi:hypothetical protein H0H92_016031 [Tricholoma furcatifolium]|nr:hypothetical protein H0H92_016031 [Tricholoma furcatifolium]